MNIFDVMEQITLLEPIIEPGQAPIPIQLMTLWARENTGEPVRATVRVQVFFPGGDTAGNPITYEVDLTTFRRLRNRMTFGSLPIVRAGIYEFQIEVQENDAWRLITRVPLELTVEPASGGSAQPS